jgi:hypothetical protein
MLQMDKKQQGRYRISKPIETQSLDEGNQVVYRFQINVIDHESGKVVKEFTACDTDDCQAAFRAVDEMMMWLRTSG